MLTDAIGSTTENVSGLKKNRACMEGENRYGYNSDALNNEGKDFRDVLL